MNVANYKQVGSWYWQTDGIELYDDGQMKNTFFHANDDVLKIYHNRVDDQEHRHLEERERPRHPVGLGSPQHRRT